MRDSSNNRGLERRVFLRYIGAGVILSALSLVGCKKKNDEPPIIIDDGAHFGSGDTAILNYAYALEQVSSAFYTKVMSSPFLGMSPLESSFLLDIRDHEIAHREFFKVLLAEKAIPQLEFDFSSIDFTNRSRVLETAKLIEDLGVSAYNGLGRLIENMDYLFIIGNIVSVEARHGAFIHDLIDNGSFADDGIVDMNGMEISRNPRQVLDVISKYIKTELNVENLPIS